MAFKNQQELEAYAEWAKAELRGMADHARNSDLFQEEAVGHATWTLPHRLFIGKVWPKTDRNTDHIESSLAETAREAARHFSLKWQLQAGRLGGLRDQDETGSSDDKIEWEKVSGKLQAQAEALYGLVEQEEIWRQTEGPLVGEPS
jgi:hypothetical protein